VPRRTATPQSDCDDLRCSTGEPSEAWHRLPRLTVLRPAPEDGLRGASSRLRVPPSGQPTDCVHLGCPGAAERPASREREDGLYRDRDGLSPPNASRSGFSGWPPATAGSTTPRGTALRRTARPPPLDLATGPLPSIRPAAKLFLPRLRRSRVGRTSDGTARDAAAGIYKLEQGLRGRCRGTAPVPGPLKSPIQGHRADGRTPRNATP